MPIEYYKEYSYNSEWVLNSPKMLTVEEAISLGSGLMKYEYYKGNLWNGMTLYHLYVKNGKIVYIKQL